MSDGQPLDRPVRPASDKRPCQRPAQNHHLSHHQHPQPLRRLRWFLRLAPYLPPVKRGSLHHLLRQLLARLVGQPASRPTHRIRRIYGLTRYPADLLGTPLPAAISCGLAVATTVPPGCPRAYAAGAIAQHSDGTLYAAALIQRSHFHAERIPQAPLAFLRTLHEHFPEEIAVLRSEDNGESWREVGRTSGPFLSRLENPCSITEAKDGSLLLLIDGHAVPGAEKMRWVNAPLHSSDRGATWQTRSIFGHNDYDMEEGHLVYLPDGRLGTCSRPWGLWITSDDEGFTWSEPRAILDLKPLVGRSNPNGCKKGDLLVTSDGTVVLLTCGRPGGNGQVLYSRDSGETWIKPAPDRGFTTDRYAYYPGAWLMPDDSIFMVGDHQGFANPYGPFGAEVIATRSRILAENEGEGIEIMRIDGALHEPWGEEQDGGEAADRKIEKDA